MPRAVYVFAFCALAPFALHGSDALSASAEKFARVALTTCRPEVASAIPADRVAFCTGPASGADIQQLVLLPKTDDLLTRGFRLAMIFGPTENHVLAMELTNQAGRGYNLTGSSVVVRPVGGKFLLRIGARATEDNAYGYRVSEFEITAPVAPCALPDYTAARCPTFQSLEIASNGDAISIAVGGKVFLPVRTTGYASIDEIGMPQISALPGAKFFLPYKPPVPGARKQPRRKPAMRRPATRS